MANFVTLCEEGNLANVIAAVERGVDVNSVDSIGLSGLMGAVNNSHNHVTEYLLQQPAIDVSRKNSWGKTALHYAVVGNNTGGLSLLLAHPTADPTVRDDDGRTPLEYCRWGTGRQGETW